MGRLEKGREAQAKIRRALKKVMGPEEPGVPSRSKVEAALEKLAR